MTLDESALAMLPPPHAVLLRLRDGGAGDELIAAALGVPVEAVPTLTRVAEAKLRRAVERKAPS